MSNANTINKKNLESEYSVFNQRKKSFVPTDSD